MKRHRTGYCLTEFGEAMLSHAWRLLTPPDSRHTPRVSAFFDFMVEEIEALRPILTG